MTGVGEALASAVVARVCLVLGNLLAQQLGPLLNFRDDMESMQSTMLTIQAVLNDAEKRSMRKEAESERLWLRKLKSAAYDIEDILSDFEASIPPKMARRRDKMQQQVKLFFSPSNPVLSQVTLAHRLKKIRITLDKVVLERRDFNFKEDTDSDQLKDLEIKNRETISEIDLTQKNKIVGRDEEKDKIIRFLLQKDIGEDISIISIVGLGGLGKTTLAQLVYNDELIKKEFDKKAWVYVSMDFNLLNIGKTVLSQIGNGGQNHDNLQSVSTCLKSVLSDDRFLIVLDDVWEEDGLKLERLYSMLTGGRPGSKVIVTTRKQRVAQSMLSTNAMVHTLDGLSDEDCWSIFSQRAFVSGNEGDRLVEIGKEIIKKCKGVPLAAVALGYILRSQKDIAAWSAVKNSEFWELEDDGVLSSLKLSYYHLPPQLRLCFTYCAIFPSGFNINKDKLIQQWIALDFIQKTNSNFTPEKLGEEYVSILLGMSFLQFSPNYVENHNLLRMHDLVHDLARSVAGDEIVVLEARKEINENKNPAYSYSYYSLLANYDSIEAPPDWEVLPDKIRALHFTNCTAMSFPEKVFSQKRSLRVLNLSGCHLENLPDSVYHLKQLRYLEVSVVANSLPESFGNLLNLEALDLSKSSLENLPISINKLEKLKTLILHGCSFLQILPESFSELKSLTYLDLSDCYGLQLLPESFGNLCKLCILHLSGCSVLQKFPESIADLKNLIHLDLSGCSELQYLPDSFTDLENLEHLNLSLCNKLEWLPEYFGNLKYLKFLNISSCDALRELPKSFGYLVNLETIDVSYCCNLEEFPESVATSGKLQILDLRGCSSLIEFTSTAKQLANLHEFILLESAEIFECREIQRDGKSYNTIVMIEHLNQIRGKLCITHIETLQSIEEAESAKLCNKSELQSLALQWSSSVCESSKDAKMDELVLGKLQPHQNLNVLTVDGYRATKFPNWVMELQHFLPNLIQITLCNLSHCKQLPPFEHLINLEILEIHSASKIRWIQTDLQASSGSFRKLKILSIRDMPDLEEWSITGLTGYTKLDKLEINRCPHVIFKPCLPSAETSVIIESSMSLSSGSVASLSSKSIISKMCIESCAITSDEWEGLSHYVIEDLKIKSCKELYFLPKGIVGVTSLNSLTINDCNSLSILPEWLGECISLKSLSINWCSKLKSIRGSFRKLKILSIRDMPNLEEITGSASDTKLERIEIYRCPRVILGPCLPSTDTLVITETSMSLSSVNGMSLSSMSRISKMCIESCTVTSDEWGGLKHYVIKDLEIKSCKELSFLPKGIAGVTSLESLTINDCNCLSALPEWLGESTSLTSLSISKCPNLRSFPLSITTLKTLKNFNVRDCCRDLELYCIGVNMNRIRSWPFKNFFFSIMRGEKIYSLEDLLGASVEISSKDNFGTTYKATLEKGQVVVVKRLTAKITERKFGDEISVIGAMNHPNLLPLVACYHCIDEKLLVYDFMPLGSISLWLHGRKDSGRSSLNWRSRSRISLAVAHGLKYIHTVSPLCAHGNIKASNILLSGNNGLPEDAMIANHGLAQLIGGLEDDAYRAPELKDIRQATQKSDIYSFGVLLMELLTGRIPELTDDSGTNLLNWVQQKQVLGLQCIDVDLLRENRTAQQKIRNMMHLAIKCVTHDPQRRPTMEVVVHEIEDICKLIKNIPDGT